MSSNLQSKQNLPERMLSPKGRVGPSLIVTNQQYYLQKLKAQRERVKDIIEMLINQFDKMADTLIQKEETIQKLQDYKHKYEETKSQLDTVEKQLTQIKKDHSALKEQTESLKYQVRELKNDQEKDQLKTELKCLTEKVEFIESRNQMLQKTNLQLKAEKEELTQLLELKTEESTLAVSTLREKLSAVQTQFEQVSKSTISETSILKEQLAEKENQMAAMVQELKNAQLTSKSATTKLETELKQAQHTLDLVKQQNQYRVEALEAELAENEEGLSKKEQVLAKVKAELAEKKMQLDRTADKVEQLQTKLDKVTQEFKESQESVAEKSKQEVGEYQAKIAALEDKVREYEEYLYSLRNESLEEEKLRKEFEMKRNQEVDRMEKIFARVRAKGIDLGGVLTPSSSILELETCSKQSFTENSD